MGAKRRSALVGSAGNKKSKKTSCEKIDVRREIWYDDRITMAHIAFSPAALAGQRMVTWQHGNIVTVPPGHGARSGKEERGPGREKRDGCGGTHGREAEVWPFLFEEEHLYGGIHKGAAG